MILNSLFDVVAKATIRNVVVWFEIMITKIYIALVCFSQKSNVFSSVFFSGSFGFENDSRTSRILVFRTQLSSRHESFRLET